MIKEPCKCVYRGEPHGIEFINAPSGNQWVIGGTNTQDRWRFCPWCGGATPPVGDMAWKQRCECGQPSVMKQGEKFVCVDHVAFGEVKETSGYITGGHTTLEFEPEQSEVKELEDIIMLESNLDVEKINHLAQAILKAGYSKRKD